MATDTRAFAFAYVNPAVRSDHLACVEMEHTMAPFDHDMMRFKIVGVDDTDQTRWTTGVPVRVQYGRYPLGVTNFFGYIGGVNRLWTQTSKTNLSSRIMEVWAVGASWPLKTPLSTVFTSVTSAQIATTVASAYGLDVDIPATSYLWPQKSAPGRTAFEFLADLARDSGCIFYVNQTQMRFYDPVTVLLRNNSVVPVFYEKDTALSQSGGQATVLDFESDVTELSNVEGRRKRNRVVQGLDAVTGAPIYAASSAQSTPLLASRSLPPIFGETVTDMVTASQADANSLLPARTVANRFFARARARFSGDARITQESPVVVEGLGIRDSGIWQVISAVHTVRKNWYSTDCVLGRDSDYDNGVRPGLSAGVARASLDSTESSATGSPATVLQNGQWRATYTTAGVSLAAA